MTFPFEELHVIDQVVRMFVDPVLCADTALLADLWQRENVAKAGRITNLGITEADVQSAAKFQALLEAEGVEVEYKKGKNGDIPAFAKNDEFMRSLLEDPDDRIRTLAEARIGAKSTLLQTRAERLGWMDSRGPLCVYLRYCGAATLRPTGGDGCNFLNFKRGSDLRRAILAPPGYLLAPIDSSQIEFRCAMYLAGQWDVIEQIRRGEDSYSKLATLIYGEPIYKPPKDDPRRLELEQKRGCGKQGYLMGIYGAGAKRYRATARAGLYGPSVDMPIEEAERHIGIVRGSMPAVCAKNTGYWAQAERVIARLAGGSPMEWGPLIVRDHRIVLPSGQAMIYDTLEYHHDDDKKGWRVRTRQGWKWMFGARLTQNVMECVSRVIVSQAMVRIWTKYGVRALNWPYDELLLLIPDTDAADDLLEKCKAEMRVAPDWLPGLPLEVEGELAERYSK